MLPENQRGRTDRRQLPLRRRTVRPYDGSDRLLSGGDAGSACRCAHHHFYVMDKKGL